MKLSKKAQAALDKMVARFQSGDLSPITQVSFLRLPDDAPSSRWTYSNRVLAFAQAGTLDCRGYRQWQEAGRQVNKGSEASFILGPLTVTAAHCRPDKRRRRVLRCDPLRPQNGKQGHDQPPADRTLR